MKLLTGLSEIGKLIKKKLVAERLNKLYGEKVMTRMYRDDFMRLPSYDKVKSTHWLTRWPNGDNVTIRIMIEAFDQTTSTNYLLNKQKPGKYPNSTCRRCKDPKKTENVRHIVSACDTLAQKAYTNRHNAALRILYWWIAHKYGLEDKLRSWTSKRKIPPSGENDKVRIWWNKTVQTVEPTNHNKPDMLVWFKEEKRLVIIEMSVPWDKNIPDVLLRKSEKYGVVRSQLARDYPEFEVIQANVVLGAMGTITSEVEEELTKIHKDINSQWIPMQRCIIIHTANILKSFCGKTGKV